ncbi:hypothetical protein ABID70_002459 [Clavibacter michiganensis]|uniref:hypothetical protein n=1 Tax=Clavibacter michiganensis TaxID=28447 RepID=UPI001AE40261|nr:hypothetical protein [Clavibacter michiganensis]MBP2456934.1 hypothetical protein [Clavibacter michiganensis]MDQ0409504.1 hypothetical protein [Clavibacter michiganensis]
MIVSLRDERSSAFLPPRVFQRLHEASRPAWTRATRIVVGLGVALFAAIGGLGLYSALVEDHPPGWFLAVGFALAIAWLLGEPGRERARTRRKAARHVARTARRLGLIGRRDAVAFTWRARLTVTGGHEIRLERRHRRRGRILVASLTSTLGNAGRFQVLDVTDDPGWVVAL